MKHQNTESRFVGCIYNEDYQASLELGKYYRVIPDEKAAKHGYLRIVDESGEDYLYPKHYFAHVEIIPELEEGLLKTS
jgi:hypothetical protein